MSDHNKVRWHPTTHDQFLSRINSTKTQRRLSYFGVCGRDSENDFEISLHCISFKPSFNNRAYIFFWFVQFWLVLVYVVFLCAHFIELSFVIQAVSLLILRFVLLICRLYTLCNFFMCFCSFVCFDWKQQFVVQLVFGFIVFYSVQLVSRFIFRKKKNNS